MFSLQCPCVKLIGEICACRSELYFQVNLIHYFQKNFMRFLILLIAICGLSRAHAQSDSTYGYVDSITFKQTEIPPMFVGGMGAWNKFLELNIEPGGPQGIVVVEFTIDKNGGSPKDVKVYRSDNAGLNADARRLIKKTKWIPAVQSGRAVTYKMRQELVFR